MTKLFGVSAETEALDTKHHHEKHEHTTHEDNQHAAVDVEIHDSHDHEIDVGQIAVDVLDLADELVIIAPVAGVDPALIDISLSRNILTLSGERKHAPLYLDAKRMLVEECYYGPFSRSIILPENLAFNKIRATVEHNTITIHVPKLTFFSKNIKIDEVE